MIAVGGAMLLTGVMSAPAEAITAKQRQLARLVNEFRVSNARSRLSLTAPLSRAAQRNARRMAQIQDVTHSSDLPCGRNWGAETVGIGDSVTQAFRRMKNSGDHRAHLLNRAAERVGTGVKRGGDDRFYVTVILCG
ncbi:MAG TPA: CAP domain-containing protein [Actinomycetota bacterium]|nr:CAP domain-containing protein [Actinomycetota bacterium]